MKRGFTLIELLVVVVVMVTLMSIVFRISSIGSDSDKYNRTIVRMQRLENCLSGYYAAFGSYPPVKLHGTRDIYMKVGAHGIQTDDRNESIWGWNPDQFVEGRYQQAEYEAWRQVESACRAQPVACRFPFPPGYRDKIRRLSESAKEKASSNDDNYKDYWQNETTKAKFEAGFDDGGAESGSGRFSSCKDKVDWRDIQLFQYGVMSYLLPRYLVMMNGSEDFFKEGEFAQWYQNNEKPCDPFTGDRYDNWKRVRDYAISRQNNDLARVANIPSQAVCARWMPNLENACKCWHAYKLFGVDIRAYDGSQTLSVTANMDIFSPGSSSDSSVNDQYILDCVTMQDGWYHDFFYYSPEPYQTYAIWSAGKNGRTFPPWISRKSLKSDVNRCVQVWVADDIIHMSN